MPTLWSPNYRVMTARADRQTVEATDRPAMNRNFAFFPWLRPPDSNASVNTPSVGCQYYFVAPSNRLLVAQSAPGMAQAVYYYLVQRKQDGIFERINAALDQFSRKRMGRDVCPSVLPSTFGRAGCRSSSCAGPVGGYTPLGRAGKAIHLCTTSSALSTSRQSLPVRSTRVIKHGRTTKTLRSRPRPNG